MKDYTNKVIDHAILYNCIKDDRSCIMIYFFKSFVVKNVNVNCIGKCLHLKDNFN